jgi:hypothetical protein
LNGCYKAGDSGHHQTPFAETPTLFSPFLIDQEGKGRLKEIRVVPEVLLPKSNSLSN